VSGGAFVGRERELVELTSALEGLEAGRGSLFLLSGEPGIGKTRLADELASRAAARGISVAWGAAWDGGGAPLLWPWIQVLRALAPGLPTPGEHLRRDLGSLWEADGAAGGTTSGDDLEAQRFRRFDALRTLLTEAAARKPLLILLEDLHAADRLSLLATEFVAGALRSMRVLLIGTHREAEARVDPALGELLTRIARHGSVLPLSRLGRTEIAQLVSNLDPVNDQLVDSLHAASGGNPLFVREMLRQVRSGAPARDVPLRVGAVISERLGHLEPPVREVLECAAILGRELDRELLAELAGIDGAVLRERLRVPLLTGILTELPGGRLAFGHPLFRAQLEEGLAPTRRGVLHRKAGELVARRGTRGVGAVEETVAHHLLAALPEGDSLHAAQWAQRAGETAFRALAFERAAQFFEGALLALQRRPDAAAEVDLQTRLAETLARTGAGLRARDLARAAAERARSLGDPVRLSRAALAYGAEIRIGVVDPVLIDLLEESLGRVGDSDPALRARLLARLAAARQPAPDPQVPVRLALEAVALARSVGGAETLLGVLHAAGSALGTYGPPDLRLTIDRDLVSQALAAGDLVLAQRGYERVAIDHSEVSDMHESAVAADAADRLGAVLGEPRWRWRPALLRGMAAVAQGRWDDAERAAAEAEQHLAQLSPPPVGAAFNLALHRMGVFRARERGEATGILPLAAEAQTTAGALDSPMMSTLVRATVHARFNDLTGARRVLEGMTESLTQVAAWPTALLEYADVVSRVGDRARAAEVLPLVQRCPWPAVGWGTIGYTWQGPARAWEGSLLRVLERWDESVAALEDALSTAELGGTRPLATHLRCELAQALLGRAGAGDAARAAQLLDAAAAEANALELVHQATRIAQVRASAGARPSVPARSADAVPVFDLTREGEVWSVTHQQRIVRLKHSRGLEILDLLVRNPGREFHVLELGAPAGAVDVGDAGEVLDATAREAYRRRVRELEEELGEAEGWADTGRSERLRAELEFLQGALAEAVGLGQRSRRVGDPSERARVNVQKRIRGVIRRIAEELPALARHLDREIETGLVVSYRRGA
jgi:hypothetical protein